MSADLTASIVRILTSRDTTSGTGFVVADDGLIATCSHVVQSAESQRRGDPRPNYVDVVFHATGDRRRARVEPDWWRPASVEDIAILQLEGMLPEKAVPLPLGTPVNVVGRPLSTFGFPSAKPEEGMAGKCEIIGRTTEQGFPVMQLRSSEITPGFSGAPVLDAATQHVVGMVTSITAPDRYGRLAETAFIIPVESLRSVCPALQIAERLLDQATVRDLFGPAVRLVNLADVIPASDEEVRQYYEGAPLTWNIIAAGGDVERDRYDALVDDLATSTDRTRLLCLSGEPGAGKSSLAWRMAAEVTQATGQPLLHVRDNESPETWYILEPGAQQYGAPLIVLVDDVFRNDDVRRALASLSPELSITLIVTSRSNEIPDDLRLPFPLQIEELGAPTSNEKTSVLQKLGLNERELTAAQRKRLQRANSWLVMMLETTTGEDLTKIVRRSVKRLKQQDEVVYRAYEYLCYAGQYDLSVPESLVAALDDRGQFYNLPGHHAGKGLILEGDRRGESTLRTLHSTIARESLKVYNRAPRVLAREFIGALQPTRREQRLFLAFLLRHLAQDRQEHLVRYLLEQNTDTIDSVLTACGSGELICWAVLYRALDKQQKVAELEAMALDKVPETPPDWLAHFKLVERRGTAEQIASLIDATAEWLAVNPQNYTVRQTYLGLVKRRGTVKQIAALIDTTAEWLVANPQDTNVRQTYPGLVGRCGTGEQIAALIDATAEWLAANPQDNSVRGRYLGSVERHGTAGQIAALIDATAKWLVANSQDNFVRERYLGLVERHGTAKQITALIDATAKWLVANPQDANVRGSYLGLVERRGTAEQIAALIDSMAKWLATNPQNANVRGRYLGLVERRGTAEQIAALIETTAGWLVANPQDSNVRQTHLELVERRGTAEQIAALIDSTAEWLAANPQNTNVRGSYLGLVKRRGTAEQIAALIDATAKWLAANLQDMNVRERYLGLVGHHGTAEQVAALIDTTSEWLAVNPQDMNVRGRYLGLVKRRGTGEQSARACKLAQNWLKVNPKTRNYRMMNNYGRVLSKLERYREAEEQFRHVLKISKGYVPARVGLAWSLYHQGKKSAALGELKHVKWWAEKPKVYPIGAALHHLGRYYLLEGDLKRAISYFGQAIDDSPEHYSNYWELGRALLAQEQYAKALSAFESASERLPGNLTDEARAELEGEIDLARSRTVKM